MPRKDGLQVAKEILALSPKQRIVFASAYVIETLAESVKQLGQVVELLQKPFDMDSFTSAIEDRGIYEELEKINVRVSNLKHSSMTHSQLVDLLAGIKKLEKEIRGQ
jgi:CheY-like chemotaxis protein